MRPTPPPGPLDGSLLLPAFWLVAALLLVGAVRVATVLHESFSRYPTATVAAVAMFAAYAVPFWAFIDGLDYLEREPPVLLATAFAWGALVATTLAITGGAALHNLIAKAASPRLASAWGSALAGPTIEELVKTLGIVAIVLVARQQVNSVLDGVVYGALVGLGFQVVEDIVYAVNAVALAGGGDRVDPVVTTFLLRGFLAGLWSHTLFGALAGAGIGYLVVRTDRSMRSRLGAAALALAGAWLCHFVWNSPLFADGLGDGGLGVAAALVAKGAPPLLVIMMLVRAARGREAEYYTAQLAALADHRVASPAELRVLASSRLRAEACRYAHGRAGGRAARAVRRLQRAQAGLAVELSRAGAGADLAATPAVRRRHGEVLAQRDRLLALGHPEALAPRERRRTIRRWAGTAGGLTVLLVVWAAIRALGPA
ncbi:MAG TPA: PrsW family intramembrane metalloprotease [Pilimelia sp.]|nr:PrsW family intramembrane metalloprotease [Pilimelia sp.]